MTNFNTEKQNNVVAYILSDNTLIIGLYWLYQFQRLTHIWRDRDNEWNVSLIENKEIHFSAMEINFQTLLEMAHEHGANVALGNAIAIANFSNLRFTEKGILCGDKVLLEDIQPCAPNMFLTFLKILVEDDRINKELNEISRAMEYLRICAVANSSLPIARFTGVDQPEYDKTMLSTFLRNRFVSAYIRTYGIRDDLYTQYPPYVLEDFNRWLAMEITYFAKANVETVSYPPFDVSYVDASLAGKTDALITFPNSERKYFIEDFSFFGLQMKSINYCILQGR